MLVYVHTLQYVPIYTSTLIVNCYINYCAIIMLEYVRLEYVRWTMSLFTNGMLCYYRDNHYQYTCIRNT